MKMNNLHLCILICLALAGCSSVTEPPIKYYILNPVEQQPLVSVESSTPMNVRVIDLRIPQYLEHFQIAKRSGQQQLTFSDDHQWGENLRKNLIRTLARNLGRQLDSPTVFTPLVRSSSKPDYAVTISIDQFEQDSEGRIQLSARYQISNPGEKRILTTRVFEQSLNNDRKNSYANMVATMQTLYNDLCVDISTALVAIRGSQE